MLTIFVDNICVDNICVDNICVVFSLFRNDLIRIIVSNVMLMKSFESMCFAYILNNCSVVADVQGTFGHPLHTLLLK